MTDREVQKLLELAENWIAQKTTEQLDDVQKSILRQALAGEKLKDIQVPGYQSSTIQREIAPKLWHLLSEITEKEVSIKKVRLVLEELLEGQNERQNLSKRTPQLTWELPGGQLDLASAFYVDRPAIESRAYEEIGKPGSLIRIKAPRQMGKTSLTARLLDHCKNLGFRSVALNFELADNEVFNDLNQFLQWFCATVTDDLQLPIELDTRWSQFLGSKKNCTNYFEKYLLPAIGTPLALGLDAVDRIFPYEKVADDFFGLLRAWHEKAKQSDIWKNFRLVIVHGTEVYIPLSNDQSPFNVGLPIELPEFNSIQVDDLAKRHGLDLTLNQIDQLMAMVGGHPHLVRVALYKIARQEIAFDQLLKEAPTETGIYGDHLRLHLWNLEQHPELAWALKQVVESESPVQLKSGLAFKLNSMGLVQLQGNQVRIRYDLYRQYFRSQLKGELLQTYRSKSLVARTTVDFTEPKSAGISLLANKDDIGDNRLAAIVFTDVKDSTQKQHNNQKPTLAAIRRDFKLMEKMCQQFEGQVLKSMGDSLLMCFVSAVKAVKYAQEVQRSLISANAKLATKGTDNYQTTALEHRIGIHLADVFFSGDDVQGDGVNIAARLQSQAQPGGICISWIVYEAVKTHLDLKVICSEHRSLKGIQEPMLLYQVAP